MLRGRCERKCDKVKLNDHNICVFAFVCGEDSSRKPMTYCLSELGSLGIASFNFF